MANNLLVDQANLRLKSAIHISKVVYDPFKDAFETVSRVVEREDRFKVERALKRKSCSRPMIGRSHYFAEQLLILKNATLFKL